MTHQSRERALLGITAALLVVSAIAHVQFFLTGAEAFWIVVTLTMTGFCVTSSTQLMGARNTLAFLAIAVSLGQLFESLHAVLLDPHETRRAAEDLSDEGIYDTFVSIDTIVQ